MRIHNLRWLAPCALTWLAVACASDTEATLVGSNRVVEKQTAVAVIEALRIRIPFEATVKNTSEKRILLRGEDNLLAELQVSEVTMSHWQIVADTDEKFTQHHPIEIEVPFVDMVAVTSGANVTFLDRPGATQPDATEPQAND